MKVSFDMNSMKELGTEHVEKVVLGLVVLLLLLFAVKAVGTVSDGRPTFTPEELTSAANSAKESWKNTNPEAYVRDELKLVVHPYYEDYDRNRGVLVQEEPYVLRTVWDGGPFPQRGKRKPPGILPVQALVATAGHGAVSMSAGGQMATRAGMRGQRWVVVSGLLPIKSQMDAYEAAFESALYRDPQRDLPVYIGYRVERREVDADGEAVQADWTEIKLSKAFEVLRYVGGRGSMEVVHQRFLPFPLAGRPPMVFPLLPLGRGTWGAEAAHPPEIPLLINMPEMQQRMMGPAVGPDGAAGEEEDGQESDDDTEGPGGFESFGALAGAGRPGMGAGGELGMGSGAMPGMGSGAMAGMEEAGMYTGAGSGTMPYGGGSNPYAGAGRLSGGSTMYGGSSPYGGGRGGVRGAARAEEPLEYQLFRFLDVSVEPGKRYQYRVQVGLANPNYKVPTRFLENVALAKSLFLPAEWSDPTEAVVVPRDSRLLAGSVKPAGGRLPTSIMYEPVCKVMAVTIRMEDGQEATHETTAYRGQLGDFVAALAQKRTGPTDMYGSGGDMYGMGEEEGMMGGGALPGGPGMPATPNRATARRGDDEEEEEISHATGMLLLDMVGGQRLHTTDAALVEPGSLLLLDPDGKLMIRDQLDDQDEFLVYHVPEEKKPSKRDRKDDRAPGYDPSGGSAGMEEMYGFGGDSGGSAGSRRGGRRGSRGSRDGGSEEE